MQLAELGWPSRSPSLAARPRGDAVIVAAWSVVILGVVAWGALIRQPIAGTVRSMKLHAAPLFGRFDLYLSWGTLVALAVAVLVVIARPVFL